MKTIKTPKNTPFSDRILVKILIYWHFIKSPVDKITSLEILFVVIFHQIMTCLITIGGLSIIVPIGHCQSMFYTWSVSLGKIDQLLVFKFGRNTASYSTIIIHENVSKKILFLNIFKSGVLWLNFQSIRVFYNKIGENFLRFSKGNRVFYYRIFIHIDASDRTSSLYFSFIIEYPRYTGGMY